MVIAVFQVVYKLGRFRFFQETFLLANISIEVVPGMLFLTFINADIQFAEKKLTWSAYTIEKSLPTIRQVEIIDQKEFAKAVLDENVKAFVVHVSSLRSRITIRPMTEAQLALLLTKKVTVPAEYSDFDDMFQKSQQMYFQSGLKQISMQSS